MFGVCKVIIFIIGSGLGAPHLFGDSQEPSLELSSLESNVIRWREAFCEMVMIIVKWLRYLKDDHNNPQEKYSSTSISFSNVSSADLEAGGGLEASFPKDEQL